MRAEGKRIEALEGAYLKGYRGGERAARGKPEPCPEPSYAVPPGDCHHLRCDCAERGAP